ncbi:MAG: CueP family metal-binding protein [Nocardioides sp.]|nr:CueP family metal-binding protein [Nocardioides sp.]
MTTEPFPMTKIPTVRVLAGSMVLLAAVLTGCSDDPKETATPAGPASDTLLAGYGLDGMETVEVIDHLDRLGGDDRPSDLMASVRPSELLVSTGDEEYSLEVPDGRFYLSVAPYVDTTHECFNHSLTTCQGELTETDVDVTITDDTNDEVLVDEVRTTFANGFVGFWLPRDIEGTVSVEYDGKAGEVDFATGEESPTCLTTLQLT